jgi:hypothetical protein
LRSPLNLDLVPGHTGYVSGVAGRAYNEAGFRHFLDIERRRAARSGHLLLLVLVEVRAADRVVTLTPVAAGRIFAALGATVREVDFVGWFRHGRVAAAALVQRTTPSLEVRQQIASRVSTLLSRERVHVGGATRIRVVPIHGKR